jgi:hypothetical protein
MLELKFEVAFSHMNAPGFVHHSSDSSLSKSPVMPNSSNTPSTGPNDSEHVWYCDADADVPWANLEVASQLGPLTMVFSLALHAFLCAYLPSSYLVQQEGRGHRKKSSSRMQELIQAEIAELNCS